jgi:hypothetical protein
MLDTKDLAASFIAERANPEDIQVVCGQATDWIKGRFNFEFREVFDDYYKQAVEKGDEHAPHILFARCPDDVESIVRFTSDWGPLHQPRNEAPASGFDPQIFTKSELTEVTKYFCFTVFWWRQVQQRFKEVIEDLSQPSWASWRNGSQERIPVLTRTISFAISRRAGALAPYVKAGSLIEAFWLMLWLDTAEKGRRVRMCANTRCVGRVFRAGRPEQIYCSPRCKDLVNKRKYWNAKGSERRRANRQKATRHSEPSE